MEIAQNIQQQRGYANNALNRAYTNALKEVGGGTDAGSTREQQAEANIKALGQILPQYGSVWQHPPYQPDQIADMLFSPAAGDSARGALARISEAAASLIANGSTPKETVAILVEGMKRSGGMQIFGMPLDDAQIKRVIERVIVNMQKPGAGGTVPRSYGEMRKP